MLLSWTKIKLTVQSNTTKQNTKRKKNTIELGFIIEVLKFNVIYGLRSEKSNDWSTKSDCIDAEAKELSEWQLCWAAWAAAIPKYHWISFCMQNRLGLYAFSKRSRNMAQKGNQENGQKPHLSDWVEQLKMNVFFMCSCCIESTPK